MSNFTHCVFFFFNDTATTEIYTLSLHDALPISCGRGRGSGEDARAHGTARRRARRASPGDRKSTRLNSSHGYISYAVFCLKKKKKINSIKLIEQRLHTSQATMMIDTSPTSASMH